MDWYRANGTNPICLYPPADLGLHGSAVPSVEEACGFSFAATNVYPRERYPYVLAEQRDLFREAAKLSSLNLYGPWDTGQFSLGREHGAPELLSCHRGQRSYDAMATVYASSRINLNSHCRPDGYKYLNERTITAIASGGFTLCDRVSGIEEILAPGRHFDTWGSLEEAKDKMKFWNSHHALRERVARAGRAYVLQRFSNIAHARALLRHVGLGR